jgi:hypothetical protein
MDQYRFELKWKWQIGAMIEYIPNRTAVVMPWQHSIIIRIPFLTMTIGLTPGAEGICLFGFEIKKA